MSDTWAPGIQDTEKSCVKEFTANLSQVAGTYTLTTATSGDILITAIQPYNSTAATGLTSVSINTNDTTPTTILGTTLLAALTSGVNLTGLTNQFLLPSTKVIQYTLIGNGTAGSMKIAIRYQRLANGADLI